MSDSNNTLGKGMSDIYMISENDGISNNTKQNNQKKIRYHEYISKNRSVNSSDTNTNVSNLIFILTLFICLLVTKRSHILKQTCSFQL